MYSSSFRMNVGDNPRSSIDDDDDDDGNKLIRKWGCDRTETPFIFCSSRQGSRRYVRTVRARFAASALHNYTRGGEEWKGRYGTILDITIHWYPMQLSSRNNNHSDDNDNNGHHNII